MDTAGIAENNGKSKAFPFSLIAAVLILSNAISLCIVARWFIGIMPIMPGSSGNDPMVLYSLSAAGIVFGVIVLFGALMLQKVSYKRKLWGAVIAAFSLPSVIMGGGFVVGSILGIISGVTAISGKPIVGKRKLKMPISITDDAKGMKIEGVDPKIMARQKDLKDIMKGIIVYDSSYGNTKKIAETMQETLKELEIEADLFYVKDANNMDAKKFDFLVLGSPTKFYTMSFAVKSFLGKVKREEWAGKPFAAFDTENPENIQKKKTGAAEKIADKLLDKKMSQLMPNLKSLVLGQKGPILEGEIERTKEYTKEFASKLKTGR